MEGYALSLPTVLPSKGASKDGAGKQVATNGVEELASSTSPPLATPPAAQDDSGIYSSYGGGAALMPASDAVHTLERMDKQASMFDGKEDGKISLRKMPNVSNTEGCLICCACDVAGNIVCGFGRVHNYVVQGRTSCRQISSVVMMLFTLAVLANQQALVLYPQGRHRCCQCMTLALDLLCRQHRASQWLALCMFLERSRHQTIRVLCHLAALQPLVHPLSHIRVSATVCLMKFRCGADLMIGLPRHLRQHCIIQQISTFTLHHSTLVMYPLTCPQQPLRSKLQRATRLHHLMLSAIQAQHILALACSSNLIPSMQSSSSQRSPFSPPASLLTGQTMHHLVSDGLLLLLPWQVTITTFIQL